MIQQTRQVQKPLTTAHLAQTMSLLALTAEELRQQIDSELAGRRKALPDLPSDFN